MNKGATKTRKGKKARDLPAAKQVQIPTDAELEAEWNSRLKEQEAPAMKCPECQGRGFTEERHGLIQVACAKCKATGVVRRKAKGDGNGS